jgi:catechol 2,3-dioxygenase-like lactoylglutathione lyase family enzyme
MAVAFQQIIPILRIFDVAKAKEFYVDYLGFNLSWEHRFEGVAPVYMEVQRGEFRIHLTEHHCDACPGANCYVRMTGIVEFHAELAARNYGYLRPGVETTEWNARMMEVIDPFGNRIRFAEDVHS